MRKLTILSMSMLVLAFSNANINSSKDHNFERIFYKAIDTSENTEFDRLLILLSAKEYNQYLLKSEIINSQANRDAEMVKRIGGRIASAVTKYYTNMGLSAKFEYYSWDFNLIKDDNYIIWTMPGGKALVSTGFLKLTQNESALTAILSHQLAHVIFEHQFSEIALLIQQKFKDEELISAITKHTSAIQEILNEIYCGSSSNSHFEYEIQEELQADHMGLTYTALSGYNPRETVHTWKRLFETHKLTPISFIFKHPPSETRIEQMEAFMPEALKYYKPAGF